MSRHFTFSPLCVLDSEDKEPSVPSEGGPQLPVLSEDEAARLRTETALKHVREAELNGNGEVSRVVNHDIVTQATATAADTNNVLSFDVERYARIESVRGTMRRLTIDDLPQVLNLYEELEMSPKAFEALNANQTEELQRQVNDGSYIDRVRPTPTERMACERHNPSYMSSGIEMGMLLEGTHERCKCSDFVAWGNFDEQNKLISFYSVFLPPRNEQRRKQHAESVQDYFSEQDGDEVVSGTDYEPWTKKKCVATQTIRDEADCTAEFHMVGISRKHAPQDEQTHDMYQGLAALGFHDMLHQPEVAEARAEGRLKHWYLARFGALQELEPDPKEEQEHDDLDNEASRKLFKFKLRFRTIGRHTDMSQVAARDVGNANVIVVRPKWNVMYASDDQVMEGAGKQHEKQQDRAEALEDRRAIDPPSLLGRLPGGTGAENVTSSGQEEA